MKRFFIVFLVVAGCSPKALTYLNEETRFDKFQTYRLLNSKLERTNLSKEGRDIMDLLESSIKAEMSKRGYQESNLSPDLVLRYEITTNRFTSTNTGGSPFVPTISTRTYLQSVVIIDLTDASQKKMFWQSSYDLEQQSRKLKKEQATEDAISEIFYSYPYRAGQFKPDPQLADWKAGRKAIKIRRKQEKKAAKKAKKN